MHLNPFKCTFLKYLQDIFLGYMLSNGRIKENLKKCNIMLTSLPTLVQPNPNPREMLIIYLAVNDETVNLVLVTKRVKDIH
ncbi:hypothetical protein CR513_40004, partial [Mucuna pruriens]